MPGRTDNEIKNVWNTHLKKRLAFKDAESNGLEESKESLTTSSSSSSSSTIMSCGHGDMRMEFDQYSDHGFGVKKPRILGNTKDSQREESNQLRPNKKPKKLSISSSMSSNNSNVSNSSQVDVSKSEDQMGLLLKFGGPYDVHNSLDEVNRPEFQDTQAEIPLESDIDFWNMLDNLASFQSNEVQLDNFQASQSSKFGDAYDEETENNKWLRYLENELGLEEPVPEDRDPENTSQDAAEPLVPSNVQHGIP